MAITRTDVPAALDAAKEGLGPYANSEALDLSLDMETQTDKEQVKVVGCRECKRPLVVTTFFAPAKAMCRSCKGEDPNAGVASIGVPIPGQTDPAKAVNLATALVNPTFGANQKCPVHPDDETHEMLLVAITHNDHYGPSQFLGYKEGKPVYRQVAVGEVATLQCQECKATTTYSTTRQQLLRPQNAPKVAPDFGHRPGVFLEDLQGVTKAA